VACPDTCEWTRYIRETARERKACTTLMQWMKLRNGKWWVARPRSRLRAESGSERYLLPILEAILHQFPFEIRGFHSDNGSEFVNRRVAQLLNKLLVEFTKSRANRSNDNALVEGKNGAVIRKHMGYEYIAAEHSERIQKFYVAHFNTYLNYHRPCAFATVTSNERGKRKRVYQKADYATPYEKLKSLPDAEKFLKAGISMASLERIERRMSDTEYACKMSKAKVELLRKCKGITAELPAW
jgi:transposase InsO family protein